MLHCKYVILIKIKHFLLLFSHLLSLSMSLLILQDITFFFFYMPINDDVINPVKLTEKIGNIFFIFQMDPVYETNSQFAFSQKCTRYFQSGLHYYVKFSSNTKS